MDRIGVPVAWCTTQAIRLELEALPLESPVVWTTPDHPIGDERVAVLDTRAFESPRALLEARRAEPLCCVLVICSREELPTIAEELEILDGIALHDEPVSLVLYHLRRVAWGATGRDQLTGVFQRSILFDSLQRASKDPKRMPLSLLIVDLDRFKAINDQFGHLLGDETLTNVAQRIARSSPEGAVVARLGGDEFAILHTMSVGEAMTVADEIRSALRSVKVRGMDITVSIGGATTTSPGEPLFTPADQALYAAKAEGGNRALHYDDIARRAREQGRDPALEGFENQARVIAQRVADSIAQRGRKLFGELKQQSDVDSLTGLFSRRYLDRRLPFELEVAVDQGAPLTIALLDVDYFGAVNKTYGWPTGDKVLQEVASRVRANTRSEDWTARYGGEEICIVMHGTPLELARPVLERVRSAVAGETFHATSGEDIEITLSGGAAERDGNESLDSLKERVSQKLLLAKRSGRNRIVT